MYRYRYIIYISIFVYACIYVYICFVCMLLDKRKPCRDWLDPHDSQLMTHGPGSKSVLWNLYILCILYII